jgi:hypothetical protein
VIVGFIDMTAAKAKNEQEKRKHGEGRRP